MEYGVGSFREPRPECGGRDQTLSGAYENAEPMSGSSRSLGHARPLAGARPPADYRLNSAATRRPRLTKNRST